MGEQWEQADKGDGWVMKLRNSGNTVCAAQVTVHLNHLKVHIASTLQCL